jgi:hypothetical protein
VPQTIRTGQVTSSGSSGQPVRRAFSIIAGPALQAAIARIWCASSSAGMCS